MNRIVQQKHTRVSYESNSRTKKVSESIWNDRCHVCESSDEQRKVTSSLWIHLNAFTHKLKWRNTIESLNEIRLIWLNSICIVNCVFSAVKWIPPRPTALAHFDDWKKWMASAFATTFTLFRVTTQRCTIKWTRFNHIVDTLCGIYLSWRQFSIE